MPHPEEKNKHMTPEEVEAMNAGTTPVIHKGTGSNWLAWRRGGVYYAKIVNGELPPELSSPCMMDRNEFFETFTVHEHDPDLCGCEYRGDNLWSCGHADGE